MVFSLTFRSLIHSELIKKKIYLAVPRDTWDLSSLTRDQPMPPAVEARSPNHWTARELP